MNKTAIYPGSFNPWTKGHQDILERVLNVFDNVIIVVAENPNKSNPTELIVKTLLPVASMYPGKVGIACTEGLISDYGHPIIRGVRSGDWEYEQNLAMWNKELGVDTFFLCPEPSISHINSSALRLLNKEGKDIRKYAGNKDSIEIWLEGQ